MPQPVQLNPFFAETMGQYNPGALFEDPMNPTISNPLAQQGNFLPQQPVAPMPQGGPNGLQMPQPPQASPYGMAEALNSPGAAMAGAGMQNLVNTSLRNYGQQVDPIQAYQQAVQQRAVLSQREQALSQSAAAEKRAQEEFDIAKDPGFKYRKLVEQGLIDPATTSYTDFLRLGLSDSATSVQKNFATWLAMNPNATDDEKQTAYDNAMRAPITYQMGGGGIGVTSGVQPGMGNTTLVAPTTATALEANLAGAKEGATQGVQTSAAQVNTGLERAWAAREAYATSESVLSSSNEFLAKLESGQVDTGVIDRFLLNTLGVGSEETAALNNETIMQGLQNLGITNLAPVTEQEFANVLKLWADIGMSTTPNIGSVKQAIARTERLQRKIQAEAISAANQVKEYGGESAYGSMLNANEFVRGLVQPNATAAPAGGAPAGGVKRYNPDTGEIE